MIRTNAITGGARGRAKLNESTGQKLLRSLRRPRNIITVIVIAARATVRRTLER